MSTSPQTRVESNIYKIVNNLFPSIGESVPAWSELFRVPKIVRTGGENHPWIGVRRNYKTAEEYVIWCKFKESIGCILGITIETRLIYLNPIASVPSESELQSQLPAYLQEPTFHQPSKTKTGFPDLYEDYILVSGTLPIDAISQRISSVQVNEIKETLISLDSIGKGFF
jgi:hypothetical protein